MSKEANVNVDQLVDELQAKHGKVVRAYIPESGDTFVFRRPTRAEITHYNKTARNQPDMAVEHAIGLCRSCFVGGGTKEALEQSFNDYCLAFAGTQEFQGVSDLLIRLATGEAAITVK